VAYVNDTFKFSWSTATTFESGRGDLDCKNNFLIGLIQIRVVCKKKFWNKLFKRNKKALSECRKFYTATWTQKESLL